MPKKKEKLIEVDKTGIPKDAIKLPDHQLRFNGVYIDPRLQNTKPTLPPRMKLGYCSCPACQWNREALNETSIAQRAAQRKSESNGKYRGVAEAETGNCLENY